VVGQGAFSVPAGTGGLIAWAALFLLALFLLRSGFFLFAENGFVLGSHVLDMPFAFPMKIRPGAIGSHGFLPIF
jgi:hypothetical protein